MRHKRLPTRKKVTGTIGLVFFMGLAACSTEPPEGEGGADGQAEMDASDLEDVDDELAAMLPDNVTEAGVLNWGVEPYYPPFTQSEDDDDTVVGINVDLAQEMSALFGVEAEIHPGSFDGLIPGIESERYDVGIATMADTEERRDQVDFIDYFESGSAVFIEPGNPENIQDISELCGHSVGAVKGTFQVDDAEDQAERCAEQGSPEMDVQVFNEQAGMLLALNSGRVDAMLMDYVAGSFAATTEGGEQFEMTGDIETPQRKGMIVSQDREDLRAAVQAAMQELVDNGSYGDILEEWGQEEGALEKITINDEN